MKAKSIIIAAIVLMAIVPTASAQEQIKKAFQEVTDELAGVTKVGEHNTAKVDANGIAIESGTRPARPRCLRKRLATRNSNLILPLSTTSVCVASGASIETETRQSSSEA